MEQELEQRCGLFVKNRDIMKENFKWDNSMLYPLCAAIYAEKGLEIDVQKIKMSKEIIKNNTGIFSSFKGIPFLALSVILSLEENKERKFDEVLKIYDMLKKEFHASEYLPLSAFIISNMINESEYDRVIQKSKNIYVKMKNEHPFLTSSEDCGFAVLTAISDISEDGAINEMEECYEILHKKFSASNALQTLSHTLALGEEAAEEKCRKTIQIFEKLDEKNCRFGKGMELAVLGMLSLTTNNIDKAVNDIADINEYLLSCKGFGAFGTGKSQRIMYAALLVAQEYKKQHFENEISMAAINSITSIIIAQHIAMMAAISAGAAASAAASN